MSELWNWLYHASEQKSMWTCTHCGGTSPSLGDTAQHECAAGKYDTELSQIFPYVLNVNVDELYAILSVLRDDRQAITSFAVTANAEPKFVKLWLSDPSRKKVGELLAKWKEEEIRIQERIDQMRARNAEIEKVWGPLLP